MADFAQLKKIRNIGIIAHIDAGKTTLTERILFYTCKIHRMGEVHEGAATMDFLPEEQERGITIASACATCPWNDCLINLIDTPGHVDFSIEVERSLRVLDGAVGVFCAVGGVEPQSEAVWKQAEKFQIPRMVFINKMDRVGASFSRTLAEIRTQLGANAVPLSIPLGEGEEFEAVIDLVGMERVDFDASTQGRVYTRKPLSETETVLAASWREKLVETAADENDGIMAMYISGENISVEMLRSAIRQGTLKRAVVPVFAGSALKNTGVQLLLDGIGHYLPDPTEATAPVADELQNGEFVGKVALFADPNGPLAALVFKLFMEGNRRLSLIRVYSGVLKDGMGCYNVSRKADERVTGLFRLDADERKAITEAKAGDIVAVAGFNSVYTGDSLAAKEKQFLLENIAAYVPVITLALEPKNSVEGEKLDKALSRYLLEDPTLKLELDEGSGQRVISGMGELHLEVLLERMKREYGLVPRAGNPQVICQETVAQSAVASGEFDRELGEVHHFGFVTVKVSPRERGTGNLTRWVMDIAGWSVAWRDAVQAGIEASLQSGVLKGYPVHDTLIEVVSLHKNSNSSPAGYHMAAVSALKSALSAAGPILLEPIMHVEISVPESHLGSAFSLLSTHGGKVDTMFERGGVKIVKATAPMRELFGFSTSLRSSTQGRVGLLMRFERFDHV